MELFAFDDDYVRRLREGDRETEAHFHTYFRDLLFLKLRRRLNTLQAIDEVRQEVFTRVLERLADIRDGRKLGAFVNAICNRVLLEYYRADNRTVALGDEHLDVADPQDPDSRLDAAQQKARVWRVINSLPDRDGDILRAVFLEEADKDEICERFGVDREYLRVLLHRAKGRFRQEILRRKSGRLSIFETFGPRTTLPI